MKVEIKIHITEPINTEAKLTVDEVSENTLWLEIPEMTAQELLGKRFAFNVSKSEFIKASKVLGK